MSYTEVASFTVFAEDVIATLDACIVDTAVVVEVGGNADGSDRVVDDTTASGFDTYSFELVNDAWLVVDIARVGRWDGQIGCG